MSFFVFQPERILLRTLYNRIPLGVLVNLHHGMLESWKLDRDSRTSLLPARHFQISLPFCKIRSLFLFPQQPLNILHLPFARYYSRNFTYIMSFNFHSTLQRKSTHFSGEEDGGAGKWFAQKVTDKASESGFHTDPDNFKVHTLFAIVRHLIELERLCL